MNNKISKLFYVFVALLSLVLIVPMLLAIFIVMSGNDFIVSGYVIEDRILSISLIVSVFGGFWLLFVAIAYIVFKIWE